MACSLSFSIDTLVEEGREMQSGDSCVEKKGGPKSQKVRSSKGKSHWQYVDLHAKDPKLC